MTAFSFCEEWCQWTNLRPVATWWLANGRPNPFMVCKISNDVSLVPCCTVRKKLSRSHSARVNHAKALTLVKNSNQADASQVRAVPNIDPQQTTSVPPLTMLTKARWSFLR